MFACLNEKRVSPKSSVVFTEDCQTPSLFYKIIGEFTGRSWAQNYGGHPRSDVALLNEQSDISHVQGLLNRLAERKGDGLDPSVPDSELMIQFKSKYCQTASENIKYIENLLSIRDGRIKDAHDASVREDQDRSLKAQRDYLMSTLTADEKEYIRSKKRTRQIDDLIDNS